MLGHEACGPLRPQGRVSRSDAHPPAPGIPVSLVTQAGRLLFVSILQMEITKAQKEPGRPSVTDCFERRVVPSPGACSEPKEAALRKPRPSSSRMTSPSLAEDSCTARPIKMED